MVPHMSPKNTHVFVYVCLPALKGKLLESGNFVYFQFIAKELQLMMPGIGICRLYYLYSVKANLVKYSSDLKY